MFKAVSVRERDRISDCDGELSSSQSGPITPEEPPAPRRSIRSVRYPGEVYPPPTPPEPPVPPPVIENGLLLAPGVFLQNEDGQGNVLPEDGGTILIGALPEATDLQPSTPGYIVDDPAGAAVSRQVTFQDLLDGMNDLASGFLEGAPESKMWLVQSDTASFVTVFQLYAYLELIGGLLPEGQILRTVGAFNNISALYDGPGPWINYGTFINVPPTATTDGRIRRQGLVVPAGPISYPAVRLEQGVRFRCVAATNRNTDARFSIGLSENAVSLVPIDTDTPNVRSVAFWAASTYTTWHCRVYDGASETHNYDTGIAVNSSVPVKFDIVSEPGEVRFYIDDVEVYVADSNLPDFTAGLQAHALSGRTAANNIEIVLIDVTPTSW
jgi:hypothetical protein